LKSKPLQFIWYNLLQTLLLLIILLSIQDLYSLKFINSGLAILYLFTVILLFLSEINKYFYLLFVLLLFQPAIRWRVLQAFKDIIPLAINMVMNQGLTNEYTNSFSNLVFVLFIPTYLIFYFNIKRKKTMFLFFIGFILFYVLYYFNLLKLNRALIYFTLTLIMYGYNNFRKNIDEANLDLNLQRGYIVRWITLITIFVMGTNLFINLLPFKNEPLIDIENRFSKYFDLQSKIFSLSMTGYQRDGGRLGGPIKDDHSVAMILTTNDNLGEVHLRGSVKTVYNGLRWIKLDNIEKTKITKGFEGIKELNIAEGIGLKLKNISFEIKPQKLKTETLFSPLYIDYIKITTNKEIFLDKDWEIYSSEVLHTNDVYYVQSLYYDYNKIEEYIKKSKNKGTINRQDYLMIPPKVPDRVYNLSRDLTKPYQDKTNLIKAAVIERYLKNTYPYSKDVSSIPKDREFVDYFLFEERKGYCSYFATAMVILCRASNIPARYVEGYAKFLNKGVNKILNKDAHAWVEVYTDELGWVTFDPTPGHVSISDYLPSYLFNLEGKEQPGTNKNKELDIEKNKTNEQPIHKPKDIEEKQQVHKIFVISRYIYLISIVMFLYVLIYVIFNIKANELEKTLNRMIFYGHINKVNYKNNTTIREYLEELERVLLVDLSKAKDILDCSLYGNKNISKNELHILNRKLKIIKQKTRERLKIKYYFKNILYTTLEPFYYLFEIIIKKVI